MTLVRFYHRQISAALKTQTAKVAVTGCFMSIFAMKFKALCRIGGEIDTIGILCYNNIDVGLANEQVALGTVFTVRVFRKLIISIDIGQSQQCQCIVVYRTAVQSACEFTASHPVSFTAQFRINRVLRALKKSDRTVGISFSPSKYFFSDTQTLTFISKSLIKRIQRRFGSCFVIFAMAVKKE